ncbi:MAG: serine protease [Ruminococcaceae bacterium]|jgi:serine protease Do|nr:serine protease [Oscillospiraceae bacterium]
MDDFENKNELGEGEPEFKSEPEINSEPEVNPLPEQAETAPKQGFVPPAPRNTNYYGQGAAPNTGYPYSSMQSNNTYPYGNNAYNPNQNNYYNPNPVRPQPPKPKKSKAGKAVIVILIITLLCAATAIAVTSAKKFLSSNGGSKGSSNTKQEEREHESVTVPIYNSEGAEEQPTSTANGVLSATEIYEKVSDVSVGVLVYQSSASASFYSNLVGEGSGVITEENSKHTGTYVITCAHVVNESGITVKVQLSDGEKYDATIVGVDNKTDIAVLLVKKTGLKAAEFGSAKSLKVGQKVYAIGNPGGTEFFGSFTSGIVSAITRPINSPVGYEMNCIQHDAAINPGNSGGALLNEYGQVIGINSSKIASSEYEGMGFAVPSETVKEIADELIANGYVTQRAKLGITYLTVAQSQAYSMVVQLKDYPAGSIIIRGIATDSSLYGTKAQEGDLIIKANGKDLTTSDVLFDLIQNGSIGDKITLTLVRINANSEKTETTEFEVEATLVEDRGDNPFEEETTTQPEYYNPFGFGN